MSSMSITRVCRLARTGAYKRSFLDGLISKTGEGEETSTSSESDEYTVMSIKKKQSVENRYADQEFKLRFLDKRCGYDLTASPQARFNSLTACPRQRFDSDFSS